MPMINQLVRKPRRKPHKGRKSRALQQRPQVRGVVLWTGYLGGAIALHVRVGNPLFSHVLFPIYIALLLWGGLYLREERLRQLLPLRSEGSMDIASKAA